MSERADIPDGAACGDWTYDAAQGYWAWGADLRDPDSPTGQVITRLYFAELKLAGITRLEQHLAALYTRVVRRDTDGSFVIWSTAGKAPVYSAASLPALGAALPTEATHD